MKKVGDSGGRFIFFVFCGFRHKGLFLNSSFDPPSIPEAISSESVLPNYIFSSLVNIDYLKYFSITEM